MNLNLKREVAKAKLKKEMSKEMVSKEEKEYCIRKARDYVMIGYSMIIGADIILRESHKVMSAIKPFLKYNDSWEIGENIKLIDGAIKRFSRTSVSMDEKVCDACGVKGYDTARANANEMLRFMMLMYDRTIGNRENTAMIADFIQALKSSNTFSDEEIANIKMN